MYVCDCVCMVVSMCWLMWHRPPAAVVCRKCWQPFARSAMFPYNLPQALAHTGLSISLDSCDCGVNCTHCPLQLMQMHNIPFSCRGFVDASHKLQLFRGPCAVGLLSTAQELKAQSSNQVVACCCTASPCNSITNTVIMNEGFDLQTTWHAIATACINMLSSVSLCTLHACLCAVS